MKKQKGEECSRERDKREDMEVVKVEEGEEEEEQKKGTYSRDGKK